MPEELIRKALRKGTLDGHVHAGPLRQRKMFHGVQQLLDVVVDCLPSPLDRPPVEGIAPEDEGRGRPQAGPEGAVSRAGVQDRRRDDRRPGVRPRLLRRAEAGRDVPEHDQRQEGAHRPVLPHDGRQAASSWRRPGRATSSPAIGLKETYTGNTLCDPDAPVALEAISFPKPVDRAGADVRQDARRRQGRRGARPAGPRRPDAEDRTPTRRRRRRSSRGWASCTWKSASRSCRRALNIPQADPADPARQAAGGVPADARAGGGPRVRVHQADGRPRQVRRHQRAVQAARRRRTIEEKIARDRGAEGPEGKPDPNNVYFVNGDHGRGRSRRSTSRAWRTASAKAAKKGYKYPFPFVDLEFDLHFGKYHDVDSSQDAFYLCAAGSVPRRAGRGPASRCWSRS